MPSHGPCAVCGDKKSEKRCANCSKYNVEVWYCSKDHQVQDWPSHKAKCGAKALASESKSQGASGHGTHQSPGPCSRCLKPCDSGTRCQVEHPQHLMRDNGSSFGPGGSSWHFFCEACEQHLSINAQGFKMEEGRIASGPRWCFDGNHSSARLDDSDERRVHPNTITLTQGPDLQTLIDSLPEDVRTLKIQSSGCYSDSESYTLVKRLPFLEKLQLVDVSFSKVTLNKELTPKVRVLEMQNVPDECDLEIVLPKLREASLHYWRGSGKPVDTMLAAATKLRKFDSYKLWSNNKLRFASNALEEIYVHRSDCLESITIWAPNLSSLRLQACYDLRRINFLETHDLAASLPANHAPPPCLRVDITNSNLQQAAMRAIRSHPRAVIVGEDPEDSSPGGMPGGMEAIFRQLLGPNPTNPQMASIMSLLGGMRGGVPFADGEDDDEDDDDDYDEDDDDYDEDDDEYDIEDDEMIGDE